MESVSLSKLCGFIEQTLEPLSQQTFNVRAEISSLSVSGGHCYMELVEKSSSGLIAKVRAICWRNMWPMISSYFTQVTNETLKAGLEVLFEIKVQYSALYGVSLIISGIDPSYTLGKHAQERRQTIERLRKDGVIDMQKELSLSTLPKRLAIISSSEAAGYQDFCHQLQESGFSFSTKLYKAFVQGDAAPQSIISALNIIFGEITDRKEHFDAVLIIRGGGSNLDLSCFDNYNLANNVAQFPLPIITGIGHTRDISVVDIVAFRTLKTPTAVADYLVAIMQEQQELLNHLKISLYATAQKRIARQTTKLERVKRTISESFNRYIHQQSNFLYVAANTIRMSSPAEIYRRGYSLTTINGQPIKSIADITTGTHITTELSDGTIQSIVI